MKKVVNAIVYIVGAIILFVFIMTYILIFLLVIAPVVNDSVSKKIADELVALPLPEDTKLIESVYESGKLVGCGNGVQYFGAILIQSELSLEELQEYYSDYAEKEWECVVQSQMDQDEVIHLANWMFQTDIQGDDCYIVYSWGSSDSFFSDIDIRGH